MGRIPWGPRKVWPDERAMARAEANFESFALVEREWELRRDRLPAPADYHRLPLSWYKTKVRRLKEQARARGVDGGLFLTNAWNIVHATGLFHAATERPFACFLPMDQEDAVIWLYPYIDDSLVKSWWFSGGFHYFDYHHAEGSAPQHGIVTQGGTVNLFEWWGKKLGELGYGDKTIGIDADGALEGGIPPGFSGGRLNLMDTTYAPPKVKPEGGSLGAVAGAIPDAWFVDISDILMRSRVVKDEAEQRLTQRAMNYYSEIHAFVRNYILERGTDAYDYEVANAARLWGMHRIMQDIPYGGDPHDVVGLDVAVACRSGKVTAYAHPSQLWWSRIERGDALQFAGRVLIGGYGGELYRSFMIAPWTDWQEKVWTVHTEACIIQAAESYAGNTCSNVARAVHEHQVRHGCAHLVYHRPGHGEGMEIHQPPYVSLGDHTVLEEGMFFTNEPGLYDIENGFGFNHSDNILVGRESGLRMGLVPLSKEWCFL